MAVSRQGLSTLSTCGLQEFIAAGPEDYVKLIVKLAADLPRLGELRATLRQRMKTSAFMDAACFTRGIESAYRSMWREWCAQPAVEK
jgi:predicted O-linked N-acetylglucosamine transferase (SPINDLY family)